jgi:ABC-type lipoprotein export system ATPase subunit
LGTLQTSESRFLEVPYGTRQLADKPTGNLDTHSSNDIFALLRQMNTQEGTAFLIVTHDQRLAASCEQRFDLVDRYLHSINNKMKA